MVRCPLQRRQLEDYPGIDATIGDCSSRKPFKGLRPFRHSRTPAIPGANFPADPPSQAGRGGYRVPFERPTSPRALLRSSDLDHQLEPLLSAQPVGCCCWLRQKAGDAEVGLVFHVAQQAAVVVRGRLTESASQILCAESARLKTHQSEEDRHKYLLGWSRLLQLAQSSAVRRGTAASLTVEEFALLRDNGLRSFPILPSPRHSARQTLLYGMIWSRTVRLR